MRRVLNLLVAISLALTCSGGMLLASGADTAPAASYGRIFVGDTHHDRIVRLDALTGAGWTAFGSEGRGINQFRSPRGVFVGRAGRIYIADSGNRRIVRIDDMAGAGWITYGTPLAWDVLPTSDQGRLPGKLRWPKGVSVDIQGRIYVTDWIADRIVRINDMHGTAWVTFGTRGGGARQFRAPDGICVDAAGHIYVADSGNDRIVRIDDMSGTGWITFGTSGPGRNQFRLPSGVFVDALGRIYVADRGNRRVVRIDNMTGAGWTSLGGRGPGKFAVPAAIVANGRGEIYVLDVHAGLIGVRDMLGTGWTVFGKGGSPRDFQSPDGLPSTKRQRERSFRSYRALSVIARTSPALLPSCWGGKGALSVYATAMSSTTCADGLPAPSLRLVARTSGRPLEPLTPRV